MSEFRKDIVSGEWIIIAPERAKRPHDKHSHADVRSSEVKGVCPFDDLEKSGNWPPHFLSPEKGDWTVAVIPNKFPALTHADVCPVVVKDGIYEHAEGMGYHDLLIFRDHATAPGDMKIETIHTAFRALQRRYHEVAKDPCLIYASTHFNWGETAGASLYHPHFQIITLPIIPPQILHSLTHSAHYFEENATCVHCALIAQERNQNMRVVAENDHAIAFAPFASRQPFELKIFPKSHEASFENSSEATIKGVVAILRESFASIRKNLSDPDLNMFVHTSPLKNKPLYEHYHWHIEIIPKISIQAGFELGTGVLINVVAPETAAKLLRGET
jgi:UDPglucose--hexose-1-phosphate uridylyltransferase